MIMYDFLRPSKTQCSDAGMAAVLICLILDQALQTPFLRIVAILLLIANMIQPRIFYFFAIFWYGLAHVLGAVMSRVILAVIFFVMVTPVGFIRRLRGADPLTLRRKRGDRGSVFTERNHVFAPDDLKKLF